MDPTVQWILGGGLTAAIAIVGGFIKYLFAIIKSHKDDTAKEIAQIKEEALTKITEVKKDTDDKVEKLSVDVEARRQETRDLLLELINTKFDAIWESIRDLKDKVT